MKLLLINPNTSQHVTDRMLAQARQTAGLSAEIEAATADFGPTIIGSRVENAIAAHGALDIAAQRASEADAVILGVSMDTALMEMREMLPIPVVGMAEASFMTARCLGHRIGCLTIGQQMIPLYEEMTARYGFADRAVWKAMTLPAAFGDSPGPEVQESIENAIAGMLRDNGADVIILCGAVLTGYADKIKARVPVVDCIDVATRLAMMLVQCSEAAGFHPASKLPGGRASKGLGPALTQLLAQP